MIGRHLKMKTWYKILTPVSMRESSATIMSQTCSVRVMEMPVCVMTMTVACAMSR